MTGDQPRVLVVEDDEPIRRAVVDGLEANGFRVSATASAEAATESLAAQPVDLVVLDIGLPGLSGLEFCRRLDADCAKIDEGFPIEMIGQPHTVQAGRFCVSRER